MPNLGIGVSVGNVRIPKNPRRKFYGHIPKRPFKDTTKRKLFYKVDLKGVPVGSRIWVVDGGGVLWVDVGVPAGKNELAINVSGLKKGVYEVRYWRRVDLGITPQRDIIVIPYDPIISGRGTAKLVCVGKRVGYLMPPTAVKKWKNPYCIKHDEKNIYENHWVDCYRTKKYIKSKRNPLIRGKIFRILTLIFAIPLMPAIPLVAIPFLFSPAKAQLVAYSSPEAPIYKDERTTIIARYTDMFSAREDTVITTLADSDAILDEGGPYMRIGLLPPSFPDYDTVYITIDVRDSIGGHEVHRTTTAPQPTCRGPPGFSYGVTAPVVVPCLSHHDIKAYSIPLKVYDPNDRFNLTADSLEAILVAYDGGMQVGDSVIERVEDVSLEEAAMRGDYGSLVLNTSMTGVDFADIDSAKIIITSLRDRRYKKLITLISPSIRTPISWQDSLNSLVIIGGYYLRGPPFITRFGYATDTLTLTSSVKELEKNQSRYIMRVYPNPVEGKSYVYFLGDISTADIKIYDIRGRLINILHPFGSGKYLWDLRDFMGKDVGNGVYIIKSGRNSQKVIIRR